MKMLTPEETARLAEVRRRYTVLSECLTLMLALQRRMSRNENNLEPKPGYEKAFEEDGKRANVIRSMMQELRDEETTLRIKEYDLKKKG